MRIERHRVGLTLLLIAIGLGLIAPIPASPGVAGSATPEVRDVVLPASIPAFGSARGAVLFDDPQGDVARAVFHVIDGKFNPFDVELDGDPVKLKADRDVTTDRLFFDVDCAFAEQLVTLSLELVDREGHRSQPEIVSFTCGTPHEANFAEELATVRPTDRRLTMNLLVLDDGVNSLSDDARFPNPEAPLGQPRSELTDAVTHQIVPAVNGIWDQCGVAFRLGTLAVVRPQHVALAETNLAERLFLRGDGLPVIALARDPLGALIEALNPLEPSLDAPDGSLGFDTLTVYVSSARLVANVGDRAQFGGVTHLRGRVSLVRWDALMADPSRPDSFMLPTRPVTAIAHEFGHNFGLGHVSAPSERDNLMFADPNGRAVAVPPQPPVGLTPAQCQAVRTHIDGTDLATDRTQ